MQFSPFKGATTQATRAFRPPTGTIACQRIVEYRSATGCLHIDGLKRRGSSLCLCLGSSGGIGLGLCRVCRFLGCGSSLCTYLAGVVDCYIIGQSTSPYQECQDDDEQEYQPSRDAAAWLGTLLRLLVLRLILELRLLLLPVRRLCVGGHLLSLRQVLLLRPAVLAGCLYTRKVGSTIAA